LLLRTLLSEFERLARVYRTSPQSQNWPHSVANFLDHREQNTVFERMAAFSWWSFNLAEPGAPAERPARHDRHSRFLSDARRGGGSWTHFHAEEDQPGANNVVVLSHSFWMRRFAGDTNILGRTLCWMAKASLSLA